MNERLSICDPVSIETDLLNPSINDTFKADLDINITERRTGRGVPLSPYSVYLNGTELVSGRCDNAGHGLERLSLPTHKNEIDTYHGRRRLITASSHKDVLWDNFYGADVDRKLWDTFIGKSMYPGTPKVVLSGGRVFFVCAATRSLAGIRTVNPVDVSNGRIKAKLYSGGIVTCFISILPSTEPFVGASYNAGYDIGIWEDGGTKLFIYSGKETVYRQRTLKANPEIIEIVLDGDIIRFLEEGVEVYSETYKPPSKLCNIYLWAHHWWHTGSGDSYADDFLFVGG